MLQLLLQILSGNLLFFALHFENTGKFPPPLSAKAERECFEKMSHGDKAAREKLIAHNLRLVAHIVKKYGCAPSDTDDLISIGTIGLIKAAGTFDYKKGTRFATYASRCVENEILMHFRSAKKHASDVHFDEPVEVDKNGNSLTLMDITPDDDLSVEEKCRMQSDLARLKVCIESLLDDREKQIIKLRYGIGADGTLTQREVAAKLGISRSYVSRIEKKALAALREGMGNSNK